MERIKEIFPNINTVEIEYARTYITPFGDLSDKQSFKFIKNHNASCEFLVECRNDDCTQQYFDLEPIISFMAAHNTISKKGVVFCDGNEARDHYNKCRCELNYKITIEYKQAK